MTRDEALSLVHEYIKNESLVRHMLCVEAAMRFYAEKFGEDAEKWGLVGLLHDFDWEIHPTLEQHPQDGAPILRQRGVDEETIRGRLESRRPYRRPARKPHGEGAVRLRRNYRPDHRRGAGAPLALTV